MKKAGVNRPTGKGKKDNPEQSQRFIETAKALSTDKTGKLFNKAIDAVTVRKKVDERKK